MVTSTGAPPTDQFSWISWIIGAASTVAIWFIAWGLRDVKTRYDKIPELEAEIADLKGKVHRLCAELGKKYDDC